MNPYQQRPQSQTPLYPQPRYPQPSQPRYSQPQSQPSQPRYPQPQYPPSQQRYPQHQSQPQQVALYRGKRDQSFSDLLRSLLLKSNILPEKIEEILDKDGLELFSKAFTHISADNKNNYELYETLGDKTANKCILWYFAKRFPHIFCYQGADIITRIKIKYIQSDSFSDISDNLGFWDYISMSVETKNGNIRHKILEDVFESFCAVVEIICDNKFGMGTGYSACFHIISKIFDEMDISIDYNSLYNPIMILKEIYDELVINGKRSKEDKLPIYSQEVRDGEHIVKVMDKPIGGNMTVMGIGKGKTIEIAKQNASKKGIEYFNLQGISKKIPEAYVKFCV